MISNYWPRLAWLALASFFLLHALFASTVAFAAPMAIRFAARLQPRTGACLLLSLRLLPFTFSAAIVAAICVPSYVSFEPEAAGEQIGLVCIAAACLALALLLSSAVRALSAAFQSFRHMRRCRNQARPELLAGSPALVIDSNVPFLALAGILRPTLIASRGLLNTLSPAALDAAIRHEQAHRDSRDNLKRLLMLCAPGLFPLVSGFRSLEQAWTRLAERAADDRSTSGDRERAFLLADALVRVARSGPAPQPSPLFTPLLPEGTDLRHRVERLLHPAPVISPPSARLPIALATACFAIAVLQPFTLRAAHELLEWLVR
ncbi:MAG TPA: M56 family metallopeptidase [Bryobacteraceae bacterium]|nr:M56 family metallopeptidase [Bryobacteraceae bacterium]